jgi:hypothetical protein
MRLPEVINRYAGPIAIRDCLGNPGRVGEALSVDVPKGATALVKVYSTIASAYGFDPAVGWYSLDGLAWEAELTDLNGAAAQLQTLTPDGTRPTIAPHDGQMASLILPPARRLNWWSYVEDWNAINDKAPDALVYSWLRALIIDAETPVAELMRLAAGLV